LISVPTLLLVGLPLPVAVGTNKIAACFSLSTSAFSYLRADRVNRKLSLWLFPLSFAGSALGAVAVRWVPADRVKPLVVVLMAVVVVLILMKKEWGHTSAYRGLNWRSALMIGGVALSVGFYDGFLGIGTGIFFLFSFVLLGFDFLSASGNTKVLNLASNLSAILMFWYLGCIRFDYGIPMGLAMVAGAFAGARMAIAKGSGYVRFLFISMAMILIGKQVWDLL
jgi:uncharacterized membrane protein YfcA